MASDGSAFDGLSRLFATAGSRRGILGLLSTLPGGKAGFAVRVVALVLAPLRLRVAMRVLGLMPVGFASWSCRDQIAPAQEPSEWHAGEQTQEPAAAAVGAESTNRTFEGGRIHPASLHGAANDEGMRRPIRTQVR